MAPAGAGAEEVEVEVVAEAAWGAGPAVVVAAEAARVRRASARRASRGRRGSTATERAEAAARRSGAVASRGAVPEGRTIGLPSAATTSRRRQDVQPQCEPHRGARRPLRRVPAYDLRSHAAGVPAPPRASSRCDLRKARGDAASAEPLDRPRLPAARSRATAWPRPSRVRVESVCAHALTTPPPRRT